MPRPGESCCLLHLRPAKNSPRRGVPQSAHTVTEVVRRATSGTSPNSPDQGERICLRSLGATTGTLPPPPQLFHFGHTRATPCHSTPLLMLSRHPRHGIGRSDHRPVVSAHHYGTPAAARGGQLREGLMANDEHKGRRWEVDLAMNDRHSKVSCAAKWRMYTELCFLKNIRWGFIPVSRGDAGGDDGGAGHWSAVQATAGRRPTGRPAAAAAAVAAWVAAHRTSRRPAAHDAPSETPQPPLGAAACVRSAAPGDGGGRLLRMRMVIRMAARPAGQPPPWPDRRLRPAVPAGAAAAAGA